MRIIADRSVCEGLGMCEATAHDYFELDDEDTVHVIDEHPDESQRAYVKAAVEACPVSALRLEG